MIFMLWQQGLFINDYIHDFAEFISIHTSLFQQLKLFSERLCVQWVKHGLIVRIIPFKVFPHLIKGMKPLRGNLAMRNSYAFFNGGDSFGIVARIPCHRIAVRSADGTFLSSFKPGTISVEGLFLFDEVHKIKNFRYAVRRQGFDFFNKQFGAGHFKPPVGLNIA
jgi:hypothetical protein